jgi:phosphate/sulfate permease
LDLFSLTITVLALFFLVSSCIEVGSNDATNLVNAIYGARVLDHKRAILLAGIFVVLGASFSSPVIDTVRKEIFDIKLLDLEMSLSVFITSYFVSIILLYVYSLFGLPVSTTAIFVFCLAGGACGVLGSTEAVNWSKFSEVVMAIIMSIFVSGVFAFVAQKVFRRYIGYNLEKKELMVRHGSWISALMLVFLFWFMLVEGMKNINFVEAFHDSMSPFEFASFLLSLWILFTLLIRFFLKRSDKKYIVNLFRYIAILGMVSMAFAFGQNDLANCASPGVAIYMMWSKGLASSMSLSVPIWVLSVCGFLMFLGMLTKRAKNVTMAEIKTGSQKGDIVIYSPRWCQSLGKMLILRKRKNPETPKKIHHHSLDSHSDYDALRASVILSVSACVIAFASGQGLPISTTYVAFASVVATGWGDGVFTGGNSEVKVGRIVWVVSGWFMSAFLAFTISFIVALIIYYGRLVGLSICMIIFLLTRVISKRMEKKHTKKYNKTVKKEQIEFKKLQHQEA